MAFGHEQLDVYRAAIEYVGWAYRLREKLKGQHRHAKDQLLRASRAIPLNIAEGNGKATDGDLLDRIVAMLTRLGQRGYSVQEALVGYG